VDHYYQDLEGFFDFQDAYKLAIDTTANGGMFVEVGSWKGQSAAFMGVEIVNSGKDIKLYCVDTWAGSDEHVTDDDVILGTLYDRFLENTRPVKDVVVPIRKTSVEAAKEFLDGTVDFVFIDAAHDYDNVLADILAWWPKVRPMGMIGGHDFNDFNPGVIKAVTENFQMVHMLPGCVWMIGKPKI